MVFGSVEPNLQLAFAGTTITILCNSFTPPRWSKEGEALKNVNFLKELLIIPGLTESDSGTYKCEGTINEEGETFTNTSQLLVGGK